MALDLVFATGFEPGSSQMFPAANQSPNGVTVQATAVHTGVYALKLQPIGYYDRGWVRWPIAAGHSEIFIAVWENPDGVGTDQHARIIVELTDGKQIAISMNYNHWDAYVDDVLVATGTYNLATYTWHHVQLHVVISNTGTIETRIEGVDDIAYSGDTQPGAATEIAYVYLYNHWNGTVTYWDDWAIATGDWPGDVRIERKKVDADTAVHDFTPSAGSDHYACVDDDTPDDDDYVYADVDGNQDLYALEEFSTGNCEVLGVGQWIRAWEDVAAGEAVKLLAKSGATLSADSPRTVATAPAYYHRLLTTDPATGVAWTREAVATLQIGQEADV